MTYKVHVFTSCAYNYFPKIRLLFNSLKKYHPEWRMHVVLADKPNPDLNIDKEPFDEITSIEELNIPNWKAWAFGHSIIELSTAIKPFMFKKLMNIKGCEKVIFLDPDIVVFSKLDDIIKDLDIANITLTPHQTSPEESIEGIIDNEICSLKHGTYNLGFLGVANTKVGKDFIGWWGKRTYHFCKDDIPNGLFTDQKWIDLVPALFEGVKIIRSSRHDVASWNMPIRKLTKSKSGNYLVDGKKLGFYHFTGFDSGAHLVMLKKYNNYKGAVKELYDWYSFQIKTSIDDPFVKLKWGYSIYSDGSPIKIEHRIIYAKRKDLKKKFPDPFDAKGYKLWLDDSCAKYQSIKNILLLIFSSLMKPYSNFLKIRDIYIKTGLKGVLNALQKKYER